MSKYHSWKLRGRSDAGDRLRSFNFESADALFSRQKEFWIVISSTARMTPLSCDLLSREEKGYVRERSLNILSYCRLPAYLQYAQVSSRAFNDSILSFHVRRIGRKRVAKYFPCKARDRETISALPSLPNQYFRRQTYFRGFFAQANIKYSLCTHAFRSRIE